MYLSQSCPQHRKSFPEYFCPLTAFSTRENIVHLIKSSERSGIQYNSQLSDLGMKRMIEQRLFHQHYLPIKAREILCSDWLSDKVVVMGTKCHSLVLYDVIVNEFIDIPPLQNSFENYMGLRNGIYAVASNPSKTLVASTGPRSHDIAVYSLPQFKPVCVGESGHRYQVSDVKWVNDEILISGAIDGTIALWHISESETCRHAMDYYYMKPIALKQCKLGNKLQALTVRSNFSLVALSANYHLHEWDIKNFKQLSSHKLPFLRDIVCLTHNKKYNLFAIGSFSHITVLEGSGLAVIKNIGTKPHDKNVLTMSSRESILTFCTGFGKVNFYDLDAAKYMDYTACATCPRSQFTQNFVLRENLHHEDIIHTSIYTHCYDSSGTRLFTGGAAWSLDGKNSYAALWQ